MLSLLTVTTFPRYVEPKKLSFTPEGTGDTAYSAYGLQMKYLIEIQIKEQPFVMRTLYDSGRIDWKITFQIWNMLLSDMQERSIIISLLSMTMNEHFYSYKHYFLGLNELLIKIMQKLVSKRKLQRKARIIKVSSGNNILIPPVTPITGFTVKERKANHLLGNPKAMQTNHYCE